MCRVCDLRIVKSTFDGKRRKIDELGFNLAKRVSQHLANAAIVEKGDLDELNRSVHTDYLGAGEEAEKAYISYANLKN